LEQLLQFATIIANQDLFMIFTACIYVCVFITNRAEGKLSTKSPPSWYSPSPSDSCTFPKIR